MFILRIPSELSSQSHLVTAPVLLALTEAGKQASGCGVAARRMAREEERGKEPPMESREHEPVANLIPLPLVPSSPDSGHCCCSGRSGRS